jgi:RNA polymerase sigma factor (sigma-70 family)
LLNKKADLTGLAKKALYSRNALNTLFDNLYPMIWHFFRIRLNDLEDTKDLTQNACIRIMQNIDKYDSRKAGFSTWVYKIIQNMLIDFFRKKTIKYENIDLNLLEGTESPSDNIIKKEECDELAKALKNLTKREKEVFELRYFFNMRNKEIAVSLEMQEKTVSSLMHRAIKKIHDLLERPDLLYEKA